MTGLLLKLPWFVSAPAIAAIALASAIGINLVLSDYFVRTFLDDADPLAGAAATSNASGGGPDQGGIPAGVATPTPYVPDAARDGDTPPATDPGDAGAPPEVTDPPAAPPAAAAGVLAQGEFRDGAPGHNGEGTAKLIRTAEGDLVLRFEDFSVTNGPDLFVYLSDDPDGENVRDGLNLGGNRATDGNINYEIPEGTDISQFKSVVIWCRSFDITFAFAPLEAV